MSIAAESPFHLERIGTIMEPDPNDPFDAWGVLNPASARHNGDLFLFPREVAEGNFSRIGRARVRFEHGEPVGVERLGIVLAPETEYERNQRGRGGVEDPRITWIEPLRRWVMAYVALSGLGPRIALAVSSDLEHWQRLGLLRFERTPSVDFNRHGNKDGMFFPAAVRDPFGRPALALLHRPTYLVPEADGSVRREIPAGVTDERESIWIGYLSLDAAQADIRSLVRVYHTQILATPQQPWEALKIGGGTPPIRIDQGWLTFYHGVSGTIPLDSGVPKRVCYAAGALVLDAANPTRVLYRSKDPVLVPEHHHEQEGIVPNVVFPTTVDQRENGRLDVYYGAADSRIGAARTTVSVTLPAE